MPRKISPHFAYVSGTLFVCGIVWGMTNYVALLRGINVGGHNVLRTKELVALFEDMGCTQVMSYIQTGNVVFCKTIADTRKFSGEISAEIHKRHGFEPRVLLLSKSEMEEAVRYNPFDTESGKSMHFFFLDTLPDHPDFQQLNILKSVSEEFELHEKVFYLYTVEGLTCSKLASKVERCMGVPATARNWNTVSKLLSMMTSTVGSED